MSDKNNAKVKCQKVVGGPQGKPLRIISKLKDLRLLQDIIRTKSKRVTTNKARKVSRE